MKLHSRNEFLNESLQSESWMDDYAHKYSKRLLNIFNDYSDNIFIDWEWVDRDENIQLEFLTEFNDKKAASRMPTIINEIEKKLPFFKNKLKFFYQPNSNHVIRLELILSKNDFESKEFKDEIYIPFASLFSLDESLDKLFGTSKVYLDNFGLGQENEETMNYLRKFMQFMCKKLLMIKNVDQKTKEVNFTSFGKWRYNKKEYYYLQISQSDIYSSKDVANNIAENKGEYLKFRIEQWNNKQEDIFVETDETFLKFCVDEQHKIQFRLYKEE